MSQPGVLYFKMSTLRIHNNEWTELTPQINDNHTLKAIEKVKDIQPADFWV